jgi:hypothetical protein
MFRHLDTKVLGPHPDFPEQQRQSATLRTGVRVHRQYLDGAMEFQLDYPDGSTMIVTPARLYCIDGVMA